jgi:hypothetical protein
VLLREIVTCHAFSKILTGRTSALTFENVRYLWEIVTCQCPYGNTGKNQMQIARLVMEKDWRPELHADMNAVLSNVVTTCWQRAPDLRPSLDAVLKILIDNNPNDEHAQDKHKVLPRNVVSMV